MSKVKKFFKYAYPLKRYSVLNVQFSAILLLKIAQTGRKFKFQKISNFYTVKNFPVNCFKTKEDEWGWAFLMSHMPTHRGSHGNLCSITLKPSLILVSDLSGHFSVNGTNLYMYKWSTWFWDEIYQSWLLLSIYPNHKLTGLPMWLFTLVNNQWNPSPSGFPLT